MRQRVQEANKDNKTAKLDKEENNVARMRVLSEL